MRRPALAGPPARPAGPPRDRLAVVAPVIRVARSGVAFLSRRLPEVRWEPYALESFLGDVEAPRRVVIVPAGLRLADDLAFLETVHRRALWPPPPGGVAGAIAGLRGSQEDPAEDARSRETSSVLLLEGIVTPRRASSAARAGPPRDWVVERVQCVRIGDRDLQDLGRQGIRWSALEPVEVVALAAGRSLAGARQSWGNFLPAGVPVWRMPSRSETPARSPK